MTQSVATFEKCSTYLSDLYICIYIFCKKITVGNITLWPNNLCRSKNLMFKMVVFKKYKVFKKKEIQLQAK